MRSVVFLVAVLFSSLSMANTSVFEMTLQQTTEAEFKERFDNAELKGQWPYLGGQFYEIDGRGIDFDGVKLARVVFNKEGKLVAVMTMLRGERYDMVKRALDDKYPLINQRPESSVLKSATYVAADKAVVDIAFHPSKTEMAMNYTTGAFYHGMKLMMQQRMRNKERKDAGQL